MDRRHHDRRAEPATVLGVLTDDDLFADLGLRDGADVARAALGLETEEATHPIDDPAHPLRSLWETPCPRCGAKKLEGCRSATGRATVLHKERRENHDLRKLALDIASGLNTQNDRRRDHETRARVTAAVPELSDDELTAHWDAEVPLPPPPQPACVVCGNETHWGCMRCDEWVCPGIMCRCRCDRERDGPPASARSFENF
jgi:hypothetical protein